MRTGRCKLETTDTRLRRNVDGGEREKGGDIKNKRDTGTRLRQ